MSNDLSIDRITSTNLSKLVFASDLPEEFIKTIPAQTLHLAIRKAGLSSSADLIEIATVEQLRTCLDLDLWIGDDLQENNLWEWLALTDTQDNLIILQKILKVVDLKIITWLISKYVDTISVSESTDAPPGDHYRTPDKGSTWIKVHTSDCDRDFYLNRLLAMIFETSADLFYQILAIPGVSTLTILEEESYQDVNKRLLSEGVPDLNLASESNIIYNLSDALKEISSNNTAPIIKDIPIIEPMIYDASLMQPLASLFNSIRKREELEAELSHILNCALIFWKVDLSDYEQVMKTCSKVKGALNIGIELIQTKVDLDLLDIYQKLGLKKLYRLGLTEIKKIQKLVKLTEEQLEEIIHKPELFLCIAGAQEKFPELPIDFIEGKIEPTSDKISSEYKAFEHLLELNAVSDYIKNNLK